MSEHRIVLCGTEVVYQLDRKQVKNINLRVRTDGSVAVSAAPHVPMREIEALLLDHAARVVEASRRGRARAAQPQKLLNSGESVRIFDDTLRLIVTEGAQNRAAKEGDRILLTVRDVADEALKRRVLNKLLAEECRRRVEQLCREISPCFAAMGVAYPTEIRFRMMKSRWGSCQVQKGILTFNLRLVEKPLAAAQYVVAHELAHFLQPDHSKRFYACLARVMPNWKACRALLKD